ncbi:6142_t:CDS:1, partial [Ambispora gerdemannii]
MLCKHLVDVAGGNSIHLSSVRRYTQYPYIYLAHINTKSSIIESNWSNIDSNLNNNIDIGSLLLLILSNNENDASDQFQQMVNELKNLAANLQNEIIN